MLYRIRRMTAAVCLLVLVAGTVIPVSASAGRNNKFLNGSDSEANNMTTPVMADLVILRPLGIAAFVLSTALFFVPVLPITLATRPGEIGKPFYHMLVEPFRFVWVDPLGSH